MSNPQPPAFVVTPPNAEDIALLETRKIAPDGYVHVTCPVAGMDIQGTPGGVVVVLMVLLPPLKFFRLAGLTADPGAYVRREVTAGGLFTPGGVGVLVRLADMPAAPAAPEPPPLPVIDRTPEN